jgi:hypothetical protein
MPARSSPAYLPSPRRLLSQGDIYLAPWAMVWSAQTHAAPPVVPPAPERIGETVHAPAWLPTGAAEGGVPEATLATSWLPVLVLAHDCEIDKEFNEAVDTMVEAGVPEDEATLSAGQRPDLDRYITASPLLPYDDTVVAPEKWEAIRAARKIGYFPFPPMPAFEGAEFLVHLARVSTVERRLLSPRFKVASLADEHRALLRFKLAEAYASRNLSVMSKLEAAVGKRIDDVRPLKAKRSDLSLALVLEGGDELHVMVKADAEAPQPERTRLQD